MPKIHSTIEISTQGCQGSDCNMPKRIRRHRVNHGQAQGEPHSHHYKSTATSDKNRFFHGVQNKNQGVTQNVSVNVQLEKEDSCIKDCFAGLVSCFRR